MAVYFRFAAFLYNQKNGKVLVEFKNYFLKTKGDDVVLFIDRTHIEAWRLAVSLVFTEKEAGRHGLGQILKDFKVLQPDYFDFCSFTGFMRPDYSYRFVRIPARLFQLTAWTISVPIVGDYMPMLRSFCFQEGKNIEAWAIGLPIFHSYAKMLLRLGSNVQVKRREDDEYKVLQRTILEHDVRQGDYELCLSWLAYRWNITCGQVAEVEKLFDEAQDITDVLEHAVFDLFVC